MKAALLKHLIMEEFKMNEPVYEFRFLKELWIRIQTVKLFRQKVAHTASEIQHADWNSLLPKGIWMGETGGAYNSGRNTVTNRFMSAFWYLD